MFELKSIPPLGWWVARPYNRRSRVAFRPGEETHRQWDRQPQQQGSDQRNPLRRPMGLLTQDHGERHDGDADQRSRCIATGAIKHSVDAIAQPTVVTYTIRI
jgi:hypothetical protein